MDTLIIVITAALASGGLWGLIQFLINHKNKTIQNIWL